MCQPNPLMAQRGLWLAEKPACTVCVAPTHGPKCMGLAIPAFHSCSPSILASDVISRPASQNRL